MTKPVNFILVTFSIFLLCQLSQAEITLGHGQAISGPDFVITPEQGQQLGNNLFHHFGKFSLQSGESATFTGANDLKNIISRVSGGNPSIINGAIHSLPPQADFWFINPHGIILGAEANLEVGGAIHLSTADYIRFEDDRVLYANPQSLSQLSLAAPHRFGFIQSNAQIQLQQPDLFTQQNIALVASEITGSAQIDTSEHDINLVAIKQGEVDLSGQRPVLTPVTPSSPIQLGKINLSSASNSNSETNIANTSGDSYISGGSNIHLIADQIDLNQIAIQSYNYTPQEGSLSLSAREINLLNSQLISISEHEGKSNNIEIKASESLSLKTISTESTVIPEEPSMRTEIFSGHQNSGNAGNIIIQASQVAVDNASIINQPFFQESEQKPLNGGNSGAILIDVDRLKLINGGVISTFNLDGDQGGLIKIKANESILIEDLSGNQSSRITAGTSSQGSAGQIIIDSQQLHINGGSITAESKAEFGDFFIEGNDIEALPENEGQLSETTTILPHLAENDNLVFATDMQENNQDSSFDDGFIEDDLYNENNDEALTENFAPIETENGFTIDSINPDPIDTPPIDNTDPIDYIDIVNTQPIDIFDFELEAGDAGDITIRTEQLSITQGGQIATRTFTTGNAGSLSLQVTDTLTIQGDTFSETGIYAGTEGSGQAGKLTINAANIQIKGGEIRSDSGRQSILSPEILGNAGDISIQGNNLTIESGGIISSTSYGDGDGGKIDISLKEQLSITGMIADLPIMQTEIVETETVTQATGNGTGIDAVNTSEFEPDSIVYYKDTGIDATNYGSDNEPGNIRLQAKNINLQNGASINSESHHQAEAGSIHIIAEKDLIIQNQSHISTESSTHGGTINIQAGDIIYIQGSNIRATSYGLDPEHNSGNLSLHSDKLVVMDNAFLEARALLGQGGNILIHSDYLIKNNQTDLDASSELGIQGEVDIDTISTDINHLTAHTNLILPKPPILLEEPCRQRQDPHNQHSSLIVQAARPKVVIKNGQLVFHQAQSNRSAPCPQ